MSSLSSTIVSMSEVDVARVGGRWTLTVEDVLEEQPVVSSGVFSCRDSGQEEHPDSQVRP